MLYGIVGYGGGFILARSGIKAAAPVEAPAIGFSTSDFSQFQRVELYNGQMYLVVFAETGSEQGNWIGVCDGGWMDLRLHRADGDDWAVKSIYAAPNGYCDMIDPKVRGELLWTAEDAASRARAQELQEQLVAAAHEVREWTERMERIKNELQAI
jgi:hypothetical protein